MIGKKNNTQLISIMFAILFCSLSAVAQTEAPTVPKVVAASDTEAPPDTAKSTEETRRALVVAKVNGVAITLGEMEDALASQPPMFRMEFASKDKQKELLDSLIHAKLMAYEAKRRGYDKDPEVIAIAKNKTASLMHRKLVESADSLSPTEEDLKKYYEDHISDYRKPEKMRIRQIVMRDKNAAEEQLKKLLAEKPELHEFRKIAKEVTEDEEGKKNGGDVGFFAKPNERETDDPSVPDAIIDAAFKLKKNGDVHPKLIETDKGFHIIMRTGYRAKLDISFEDSKDRLEVLVKRDMKQKRVEEEIEKLKEKLSVTITEENLKHVVIDLSEETKGAIPPSPAGI